MGRNRRDCRHPPLLNVDSTATTVWLRIRKTGTTYVFEHKYNLTYNAESKLYQYKLNSTPQVTYTYDADGNLAKKVVNGVTTTYVGNHYEKTGSVITKYYDLGGRRVAMREGNTRYFLQGDHLGSASLVTNSSAGVHSQMRYTPYGETRWTSGTLPTDRRYTGQRFEAGTGLYDYNARHYDPALGRFVQADTLVPDPGNPQALNRYAYVYNNPLRYTDPSGHCVFGLDTLVCIVVAGAVVGTAAGYGYQVYGNLQQGMTFQDALTTDIQATPIVGGAFLGGAAGAGASFVATALGVGATGATAAGTTVGTAATMSLLDGVEDEARAVEVLVGAASRLNELGLKSPEAAGLVETITRGVTQNAASAHVSLGHYPSYIDSAVEKGYSYLNIPESVWNALGNDANRWAINKQFLDNAIARGSGFVMVTELLKPSSFFSRELDYLRALGILH